MQAEDGLSLDAQRAAITAYCKTHDLRLIRIFEDVESGARSDRRGLQNALEAKADIFVVLKLFLPFYTTKTTGTGLGLAIVGRIAEAQGGTLNGENRFPDGSGARFILTLSIVAPAGENP